MEPQRALVRLCLRTPPVEGRSSDDQTAGVLPQGAGSSPGYKPVERNAAAKTHEVFGEFRPNCRENVRMWIPGNFILQWNVEYVKM